MVNVRFVVAVALALIAVPAAAQNVANGEDIYMRVCRSCHGFPPSGGPERAAGNPALIQEAINGRVAAMAFLRPLISLSDTVDIAAWLATLGATPPPPPPAAPPVPAHDFTDLWWNPAESGWGLNLIQHGSHVIFGVMYTYDAEGRAAWFVLPGGEWTTPLSYTGGLYRVTGPAYDQAAFDPAQVNVQQVGTATLLFVDRDNGNFAFTVDGVFASKIISRQPF